MISEIPIFDDDSFDEYDREFLRDAYEAAILEEHDIPWEQRDLFK